MSDLMKGKFKDTLPASSLFVLLAFLLMIISSCFFMFRILNSKLLQNADEIMDDTKQLISHFLTEPEISLNFIASSIEGMHARGESLEAIKAYMTEYSPPDFLKKARNISFRSVYGYFYETGEFYDGVGWQPPEEYNPLERPWYKAALAANGNVAITSPYTATDTKALETAYARLIFNAAGAPIGIICINFQVDYLKGLVVNKHITPGSYGFMLDENRNVIIHPNLEVQGEIWGASNPHMMRFTNAIKNGLDISLERVPNYSGMHSLLFGRQLDNGWYLCIIIPEHEYYKELYNMVLIISILGAVLAISLILVLVRMERAKKKTEIQFAELKEIDDRTKLMLDTTPLSCELWDSNLNIIDCNEKTVKFFGVKNKQAVIDGIFDFSPEFQPDGQRSKEKVGIYIKKALEEGSYTFDWIHRMLDGTSVAVEVTLVRVWYGNGYVIAAYTRDLRELKLAQEEMHRLYEQRITQLDLMQTVNNTAAILLASNTADHSKAVQQGMKIFCKKLNVGRVYLWQNFKKEDGKLYFKALHRWTAEGLIRWNTLPEFSYQDTVPSWPEIFSRHGSINGPIDNLPEMERKALEQLGIQSTLNVPIFIKDEFWGFVGIDDPHTKRTFSESEEQALRSWGLLVVGSILRNNTSDRLEGALVEAETANRAKSAFLAVMSHEIRTPMNSIMGFAELAMGSDSMPQTNEYLGKIADSTKWLLRIINDILDISKIESGKMELERVPFSMVDVFSRCQSVILPAVKNKNLDLSVYMEPSIGKKLLGDPVRLYQIFINLLSNAVKFTNSGTVKFSSAIKSTSDDSATIYFEVRDTGIGMNPEQVKKVFEPFMQADSSTTRNYGGTGLGLAIAKNFVELMGGKLKVESTLGVGSAFSFELTFNTVDTSDDTSEQKKFDILGRPHFEGLVLICDDNSLNQQVICAHLARVGLKTITAENGKIGVDIVKKRKEDNEKPFDLILMDMFMPVMDGMEAASKIIALETGSPIVAMTANVMVSELEKYKKNGMPDCLGKPFTTQELWRVLLKYFTPLSSEPIDDIDEYCESEEQLKMMQLNFYKNSQNVHLEIAEAVAAGDTKLAHRLAHTLKGNAGMLGKMELKNAALDVESLLKEDAASIWESKMNKLENELRFVLEELKPQFNDSPAPSKKVQVLDAEQTQALFDELEPMLENINPGCVKLLDDVRAVPGAEELVLQMERFNFKAAAKALADLRRTLVVIVLAFLPFFFGCKEVSRETDLFIENISYKDIPGVTAEEIAAIEALKEKHKAFTYVSTLGTESFINKDGQIDGYITLFSDWLYTLFGIKFIPEIHPLVDIYAKLNSDEIDFAGMTVSAQYKDTYFSSEPIASRSVKIIRIAGSQTSKIISLYRQPRYIFLKGSVTFNDVSALLDSNSFQAFFAEDYEEIYQMLLNGEADAFIAMGTAEGAFDNYGYVVSEDFYPLIYNNITMTTKNSDFAPIISVVSKALQNGGTQHLTNLYNLGYEKYLTHKFSLRLTPEEREYIKNNPIVKIGAQYYNYPIDFYNTHEKEWQGIMIDVLNEVSSITGITFEIANSEHTEWQELLQALENKKVSFVTQLGHTAEREERFLWPETALMQEHYILISKSTLPRLKITEITNAKVGLIRDFSHSVLFQQWFPNHAHTTIYNNFDEIFAALSSDEIDIAMSSMIQLLALTNYHERSGYKANFIFDYTYNITPGFNQDEAVLVSIMDKAFQLIDVEAISKHWMSITFDYQAKLLKVQRSRLYGATALFFIIIILVSAFFIKSRNTGKKLEKLVALRTAELQTRTEEALAASRAKSAFLAMMSHEIRTPMNSITGFAELAIDSDSMPQVKNFLSKITSSVKWLLRIINDVLDISKIEAGKLELLREPFDLQDVFSRCQSVILPDVKDKGLDLSIYAEPSIGKQLLGDPVRLYQALMNLLNNAVKFTETGVVKFSSSIKNSDDNKTTIYFEVRDTGIGMTEEQIKKIFEPFVQVDTGSTRNYEGTGLGLTITKNIVEQMDGKMMVKSMPSVGSTFSFEITFDTIDASNDAPEQKQFEILEKPNFSGLVLICDDNSMNQQVICAHLARVGLQTITVENGKLGVEMVRRRKENDEKPFDLIFMDMFMPVMDGIEATSKIMALNTGTPIVAMTANVMPSELERYKRHGMPDCLGKPFTTQELWRVLLKYFKPVSSEPMDDVGDYDNEKQLKIMQLNFYKGNQNVYSEIMDAVAIGDTRLAHRLAHTLKGNAAMLGRMELKYAALDVETLLKDGVASIWENKMNKLKTELALVLEELKPLIEDSMEQKKLPVLDAEQTKALFEKLESMLENINPGCIELLDEIRAVPGSENLVQQIERFNFKAATKALAELKEKLYK
ncbi:MAG: response regulator [Fibromonadaceae bacterium]|jgi:signal transduction histidine kinase/DNA-binding response OmpR family regulator/PAS domain-containing protein|nr:response regulator [Fibromonadaceae bacterium]